LRTRVRQEDVPEYDEDDDAGRDLPVEVMCQLCQHLHRTATELLTGAALP
jgi:hypothetical protein